VVPSAQAKDPALSGWSFWIDRGGTFTDCIGRAPDGRRFTCKLLSSDSAPVEGIRSILAREEGLGPGEPLPPCEVKLGSTVATNALLERRGAPTVLVANCGLGDVLAIGTQERPALFDLNIRRSPVLHSEVVECAGRVSVTGVEVEALDLEGLSAKLVDARERGLDSIAISLIHAYAFPEFEERIAERARKLGFAHVVCSHEIAREMGLLARGETTVADAYLTPLLRAHVSDLVEALPGSRLRFMQSSGGLTDARRFRGPNALLSGPAGGVVAAARVATQAGYSRAVGFDMGGTSTDVSLIEVGEVDRAFETQVGGVRVRAPMLRIHTVAAGGGSLCRFDGFRLTVGPESAGSDPGPLCYGVGTEDGRPKARELSLTDVNLALGRVQPDRFPFPLRNAPVSGALGELRLRMEAAGVRLSPDEIAGGFVEIANASMAEAIAQVSVARGIDPRGHVLVGFGGAGGQHACAIARRLGIETVLLHPLAGLLSAYGIGVADVTWDGQRDAGRLTVDPGGRLPGAVEALLIELEARGKATLGAEGVAAGALRTERRLDMRYRGSESALTLKAPAEGSDGGDAWLEAFAAEHRRRFGYTRPEREVEIVTARVRAVASPHDVGGGPSDHGTTPKPQFDGGAPRSAGPEVTPLRRESVYFGHRGRLDAPVYNREDLCTDSELVGPALILEETGTVVLDPGFVLRLDSEGVLHLRDCESDSQAEATHAQAADPEIQRADPVRLEVFGNRFMSMAEQMGAVLRNTAVSTNIKERLDYSCAVFDAHGGLVANAPHIPVHLGAMGATVRAVRARFPDLASGDAVVTNDPFEGGSHLPDVTVVSPVFVSGVEGPSFFVASRGHHADLGGTTPGSMPPDSACLEDEGVLIPAFRLVSGGRFDEARIRELLGAARYPARCPDDNVADLVAMVAANRTGERLLKAFVREEGSGRVAVTMEQLQRASAAKVAREIDQLPDGVYPFADRMDSGIPLCVEVTVKGDQMRVDFAGTGLADRHNLNAPRAVVEAALIYVVRSLVAESVPLNGGCLAPVTVAIPAGSLLDPPRGSAVVGGNVETSQRIVDVLLGALGIAAASQGTMNNVTFGNADFGYYETLGGGSGGGPKFAGASGVHTHMTNTRITDPEVLEARYPVRLERFALRVGSRGAGQHPGGDGLIRTYRFLADVTLSLLTERREVAPWGLAGGDPAKVGRNVLVHANGRRELLGAKSSREIVAGDCLIVETPGGGGWGPSGSAH
jgi:5-oxoprolinase (ATP-hydrolysing)